MEMLSAVKFSRYKVFHVHIQWTTSAYYTYYMFWMKITKKFEQHSRLKKISCNFFSIVAEYAESAKAITQLHKYSS
jgi:hypothetical protein